MKKTQEVLGPLNKLTSQALIDRYEFLNSERTIRKTTFTNGVTATVNGSDQDYMVTSAGGVRAVLPPYGFLIEAGTFVAFVARGWDDLSYESPALFTLTSLDGKTLDKTSRFRVFHGFGDSGLLWKGTKHTIVREAIIE